MTRPADEVREIEELARKLHEWYLLATEKLNPDSYNPKAQKQYDDLTPEQQSIDIFIAGFVLAWHVQQVEEMEREIRGLQKQLTEVSISLAEQVKSDEQVRSELESCRDANVQKKKRIASLEDALKRAEGVSVEEIESCLWKQFPDLQTLTKPIAQAIHALLTTRKGAE